MLKNKHLNKICDHEVIWDENTKVMTFPLIKFGYCTKCNKSCKKVGSKLEWQD